MRFKHRYDIKNGFENASFNPSQVRFKQSDEFYLYEFYNKFQSLTGAIQTFLLFWLLVRLLISFNPSQVRFKQWGTIYYDL